jgi:hypothetical protein
MFKKEATIFSEVEVCGFLGTAEEDSLEELEACLVKGFNLTTVIARRNLQGAKENLEFFLFYP